MSDKSSTQFSSYNEWITNNSPTIDDCKASSRILKSQSHHVHLFNEVSFPAEGDEAYSEEKKPELVCVRENDLITGIEITCTCGEIIRLQFDYDSDNKSKQ